MEEDRSGSAAYACSCSFSSEMKLKKPLKML